LKGFLREGARREAVAAVSLAEGAGEINAGT
jgi:hypothetical protein